MKSVITILAKKQEMKTVREGYTRCRVGSRKERKKKKKRHSVVVVVVVVVSYL